MYDGQSMAAMCTILYVQQNVMLLINASVVQVHYAQRVSETTLIVGNLTSTDVVRWIPNCLKYYLPQSNDTCAHI